MAGLQGPDPLYALPEPVIDAVKREVPNFFNAEDEEFERDLARTASLGFFLQQRLGDGADDQIELTARAAMADRAVEEMIHDVLSGVRAPKQLLAANSEQQQIIGRRQQAYLGWLVCNSLFQMELRQLRLAHEASIREHGCFPALPRWPLESDDPAMPFPATVRADCFAFYRRWGLERLVTWDYPMAAEADFVGGMVHIDAATKEAGLSIFVPWYMLRGKKIDLEVATRLFRAILDSCGC